MKNIRNFLSNTLINMTQSVRRFPVAVFLAAVLAFVNILLINEVIDEEYPRAFMALITGIETALVLNLSDEKGLTHIGIITGGTIAGILSALIYTVLGKLELTVHVALVMLGIILTLAMAFVFLLYYGNEDRPVFGHMVQSMIYCGFAVLVAYLGLLISILAFYFLIYEFDDLGEVILKLTNIMALAFFIMLCGHVPEKNGEIGISRAYSTIFNKIGFAVYLSLIAILYIYIIKIIITWQLPVGRLNWFGSLALLFYVLFYLNMTGEEGAPQKLFVRYGGLMLLPILAIQLFAIYIRVSAYGLTDVRYASLVLILFAVLFIVNSVIRKKITWVFVAGAVISLLVTVTPLNLADVPARDQASRLMKVVNKYGLLSDGKYTYSDKVSEEDREILISCHDYLRFSDGKMSDEVRMIAALSREELVGKEGITPLPEDHWLYYNYIGNEETDISAYSRGLLVNSYEVKDVAGYDLTQTMLDLYASTGGTPDIGSILLLKIDDDTALIVFDLNMQIIGENEIGYFDLNGYLLKGGEQ